MKLKLRPKTLSKLLPLALAGLVAMVGTAGIFMARAEVAKIRTAQSQDLLIREQTKTAISMLEAINKRAENGEISAAYAKKMGGDVLRDLHFITNDSKEMTKDMMTNAQKPDGGYTNYSYPKPDGTKPLTKRAYSLEYKPFGWVIGTGYYLDDLK